ncbi:MAG TPA: phage tail tape measure protein [Thermogutta sp.]|nr:phage tail tape measure protein [Thermogutta sp.]
MATPGSIRAGKAHVEIGAVIAPLEAALRKASMTLKAWGSQVQSMGQRAMLAAGAMAAPVALSGRVYAGFSDQMKAVQAVSGATAAEMRMLTNTAEDLGRTTSYTAAQVGEAMLNLARSGFRPKEINDAISGILALARATGTDLALAGDIAAGTLRAFNLEATESQRVADVLTAAANNSAQTLEDLGEAMKYVAPVAQEYGLSIEETAKAIGALANVQIKGSMAGTSLRQMMVALANPAIRAKIEALGVAVTDATGGFRKDFGKMLLELGEAMKSLPAPERLALLYEVFGQRSMAAAAKLAVSNFQGLNDAIDNAAGNAQRAAEIMDSGLGGAWRRLTSALEGVQIAIGKVVELAISPLMDALGNVLVQVAQWINANRAAVMVVLGAVAAVGTLGATLFAAGIGLKAVGVALGTLATIGKLVALAFAGMQAAVTALLSPLGLLVASLAGIGALAVYVSGAWKPLFAYLGQGFQWIAELAGKTWKGISDALASGNLALAGEIAMAGLKTAWYEAMLWIQGRWIAFKAKIVDIWYGAVYGIAQMALTGFAALQTLWTNVTATFRRLWIRTTTFISDTWDRVYTWLAKSFVNLTKLFSDAHEKAAAKQAIDDEYAARAKDREKAAQEALTQIEREGAERRQQIDRELMDSLITLEEDRQRAVEQAGSVSEEDKKRLAELKAKADAARKRLDELTEQAELARAEAEKPPEMPELPEAPQLEEKLAAAGAKPTGLGGGGTAGTFSALAVRGLAVGGPLERIAKSSEETAENTRRMNKLLEQDEAKFV